MSIIQQAHEIVKAAIIAEGYGKGDWLFDDFCTDGGLDYFSYEVARDKKLEGLDAPEMAKIIIGKLNGSQFINSMQQCSKY